MTRPDPKHLYDIDDVETWITENGFLLCRMWLAQDGICSLCAGPMPRTWYSGGGRQTPSVEHTIPRERLRRTHLAGTAAGNVTAAHRWCNSSKMSRPPTGCDLIWADAVAIRLGLPEAHARFRAFATRGVNPVVVDLRRTPEQARARRTEKRKRNRANRRARDRAALEAETSLASTQETANG
jgi:hypothetical protein